MDEFESTRKLVYDKIVEETKSGEMLWKNVSFPNHNNYRFFARIPENWEISCVLTEIKDERLSKYSQSMDGSITICKEKKVVVISDDFKSIEVLASLIEKNIDERLKDRNLVIMKSFLNEDVK